MIDPPPPTKTSHPTQTEQQGGICREIRDFCGALQLVEGLAFCFLYVSVTDARKCSQKTCNEFENPKFVGFGKHWGLKSYPVIEKRSKVALSRRFGDLYGQP